MGMLISTMCGLAEQVTRLERITKTAPFYRQQILEVLTEKLCEDGYASCVVTRHQHPGGEPSILEKRLAGLQDPDEKDRKHERRNESEEDCDWRLGGS